MARAVFLALMLCWALIAKAQIPVPPLTGRVTDQTSTLTTEQRTTLEQTLRAFEIRKDSQLAVLLISTTAPETIEQYSLRVAEQWKLGRKKIDDGAILIIAKSDRTLRIEVGYGLEGVLNDAVCKRIISEIITPRFRQGDFYSGITTGVNQIIRIIDGESLPEPRTNSATGISDIQQYAPVVFMLALVVGGVLRAVFGRFFGALITGGVVAVVAWLFFDLLFIALGVGVLAFIFTLLTGRGVGWPHGGIGTGGFGGGGFSGGGGGFSGGGGGFSGGGGGFGGGGASGRW